MIGLAPPGGRNDKLADAIEEMAKKQRESEIAAAIDKVRAEMTAILTVTFDRGAAYTNLITLGGYAGIFGIWSYTRVQLSPGATILVALLLIISLTVFISFEVYKIVHTTQVGLKQRALIVSEANPEEFIRRLEALKREVNEEGLRWYLPIWVIHLVVTMVTALGAIGLLVFNFLAVLLGFGQWPS